MKFFDCNLAYGPDTMRGELAGCPSLAELRAQLNRAGISGGLVYYALGEAILGNATIAGDITAAADIDSSCGLYGVWSLLQSCTAEIPAPGELPAAMRQNRIAALTINPQTNHFLPRASVIGDYLEMAQEHRIPVLLNTGRGLTLEQADILLENFRELTVILTYNNCWPSDRFLRPFLDTYPNLYLDISYMQTAAGLPDIAGKYTASRFLFGSAFPECYLGAHMMVIQHAEMGDSDKELIAGGNLLRILEGARYE